MEGECPVCSPFVRLLAFILAKDRALNLIAHEKFGDEELAVNSVSSDLERLPREYSCKIFVEIANHP